MDLVTRKWICEIVSNEETPTQVQVVFMDALELEGLLKVVEVRQDQLPSPVTRRLSADSWADQRLCERLRPDLLLGGCIVRSCAPRRQPTTPQTCSHRWFHRNSQVAVVTSSGPTLR